jgi:hypothetical protein
MPQDGILDVLHRQIGQVTCAFLAPTAEEIEVVGAAPAGGPRDDEAVLPAALLATVAPEGALEVVVVRAPTLAAHAARVENALDMAE